MIYIYYCLFYSHFVKVLGTTKSMIFSNSAFELTVASLRLFGYRCKKYGVYKLCMDLVSSSEFAVLHTYFKFSVKF
jgi:hypothetical protein